jgi:hypothetical protein
MKIINNFISNLHFDVISICLTQYGDTQTNNSPYFCSYCVEYKYIDKNGNKHKINKIDD